MVTWQDANRRSWTITLTLELADQVLSVSQVDLLPDDNDYRDVIALCIRPRKLAIVLWECSRKAANSLGVDRESFNEALDADALHAGWKALQESIEVFSSAQQQVLGEIVRQSFQTQMRGIEAGVKAMVETMQSQDMDSAMREAITDIDKELRSNLKQEMKRGLQEALGHTATNSQAS